MAVALITGLFALQTKDNVQVGKPVSSVTESATSSAGSTEVGDLIPGKSESKPASKVKSKLGVKYARNFRIDYMDMGIKLVTDSGGNKLLLVPKGIDAPEGHNDATLIKTPIMSAMYNSTTYVGFLDALDEDSLYDSVAIVTTAEDEWDSTQIRDRFKSGVTQYISHGYTTVGDIEIIAEINPDIVFTGGNDDMEMQLRSLLDAVNIKHTTLLEWTEEGNLAYLEWIKFFAAFYNLDEEADRIFEAKLAYFDELYCKAANVSVRPTVAYCVIDSGKVNTQSGSSTLARQIALAGGAYALPELHGAGSITITMEEFLNNCRDTDIIIYGSLPRLCPDKAFLLETEPLMAEFKAFQNDKIYIFSHGHYMDNAKLVEKFEDLMNICHPDMFPERELVTLHKLP